MAEQAQIDGSIYEGMMAAVSVPDPAGAGGLRTIAHCPRYADALAIVEALASSPTAAEEAFCVDRSGNGFDLVSNGDFSDGAAGRTLPPNALLPTEEVDGSVSDGLVLKLKRIAASQDTPGSQRNLMMMPSDAQAILRALAKPDELKG